MNYIITYSDKGEALGKELLASGLDATIHRSPGKLESLWKDAGALIFIGALGICVREIAPLLKDKKSDPAVLNMDPRGRFVQSVVSGHLGGANQLSEELARLCGASPVITTLSDSSGMWALDLLPENFGWKMEPCRQLTRLMADFLNGKPTALLLEVRDHGTYTLESSLPGNVKVFYKVSDLQPTDFALVIAVTPYVHDLGPRAIVYRPPVLQLGLGAQKGLPFGAFKDKLESLLADRHLSPLAIEQLVTIELKKNEAAFVALSKAWGIPLHSFNEEVLASYKVPSPSAKVTEVTGVAGVAEAAAMHLSGNQLLVPKTKARAETKHFTFALAIKKECERKGHVEFVGAGPGDPELISVRGQKLLGMADLVLYTGSLVPGELALNSRSGCVVKSSAGMDLQRQMETMKEHYEKGRFIVRLHTGDPCIYGAIQEQMTIMDQWGWNYHITPGISSFQAAAAALKSQFTIPGEVQTIILTRGEGRTPVPEREKLSELARSQSTMCIYLSASLADKIQEDLLIHYPPDTPVAVCYKLSWKEEQIYRCPLKRLAQTVSENNLTMTTLIVVGTAIDNRSGASKLYDAGFSHAFRDSE